jgi:hypothetical protein
MSDSNGQPWGRIVAAALAAADYISTRRARIVPGIHAAFRAGWLVLAPNRAPKFGARVVSYFIRLVTRPLGHAPR